MIDVTMVKLSKPKQSQLSWNRGLAISLRQQKSQRFYAPRLPKWRGHLVLSSSRIIPSASFGRPSILWSKMYVAKLKYVCSWQGT